MAVVAGSLARARRRCGAWRAQAVVVVEAGCRRRTVAPPLRLRAAALYGLLGAPGPALAAYRALNIKHIQHDTITGTLPVTATLAAANGSAGAPLAAPPCAPATLCPYFAAQLDTNCQATCYVIVCSMIHFATPEISSFNGLASAKCIFWRGPLHDLGCAQATSCCPSAWGWMVRGGRLRSSWPPSQSCTITTFGTAASPCTWPTKPAATARQAPFPAPGPADCRPTHVMWRIAMIHSSLLRKRRPDRTTVMARIARGGREPRAW